MTDDKKGAKPGPKNYEGGSPKKSGDGRGARIAAARGVMGVIGQKLALDIALSKAHTFSDLSARDRAFARLIAATTLRRLAQLDGVLNPYLKRQPAPFAMAVLLTGAAQLIYLDTPVHAAVGESVAALKSSRDRNDVNAAGMVNAVLRRVSETGKEAAAEIGIEKNLPGWLRDSWNKAYGKETVKAICEQLSESPPLDLTIKDKSKAAYWAEQMEGRVLPTGTVRKDEIGNIVGLPGFHDGEWWVQDIAAALPVNILGDLTGKTALDMCAAPGGKTLQLAAAGATVTALDRSAERLLKVEDNLQRTGLAAKCIAVDAAKWRGLRDHDFDVVLLDAPCSATGTLRRRPDVAYTKSHKDVVSLKAVQERLLLAAARQVKAGGTLVYCTCSLQREECEWQIEAFLKSRPDFRLNPILTLGNDGEKLGLQPEGWLRAVPSLMHAQGGMDGFFVAMLTRNV